MGDVVDFVLCSASVHVTAKHPSCPISDVKLLPMTGALDAAWTFRSMYGQTSALPVEKPSEAEHLMMWNPLYKEDHKIANAANSALEVCVRLAHRKLPPLPALVDSAPRCLQDPVSIITATGMPAVDGPKLAPMVVVPADELSVGVPRLPAKPIQERPALPRMLPAPPPITEEAPAPRMERLDPCPLVEPSRLSVQPPAMSALDFACIFVAQVARSPVVEGAPLQLPKSTISSKLRGATPSIQQQRTVRKLHAGAPSVAPLRPAAAQKSRMSTAASSSSNNKQKHSQQQHRAWKL